MQEHNEIAYPDSPVEIASWVRDRSVKIVEELAAVVCAIRTELEVSNELQASLHFPLSGALANAIKLAAFSSGLQVGSEEISDYIGEIYKRGPEGVGDLLTRIAGLDDPPDSNLKERQ